MAVLVAVAACAAAYALVPVLLVLPHELGHAIVARAFGARRVEVEVGAEPRRIGFEVGGLSLRMRLLSHPRWLWYGTFHGDLDGASRWRRVVVLAGGPLTSLALTISYAALGAITNAFGRWFFWFLAISGAWTFLVTAAPIRYGRFFGPCEGASATATAFARRSAPARARPSRSARSDSRPQTEHSRTDSILRFLGEHGPGEPGHGLEPSMPLVRSHYLSSGSRRDG